MMIRKQAGAVILSALAIALMGGLPLVAQEPAAPKPTTPAKTKSEPSRRVPAYFGQIALTPEQRGGIYGIQGKHAEKIEALEKQIAEERAAMLSECEALLSDVQKKLLDNLRTARAKTAAKPSTTPKSSN